MSTLNSFSFPYCTPALFVDRYDVRTSGDLLSDNDTRLTPSQVLNSTVLMELLKQASGELESFATKGGRYSIADLIQIASLDANTGAVVGTPGNTANNLYGIVAGVAMFFLWERRPARLEKMTLPRSSEYAWTKLQALGEGQQIFGLLEVAEAPNCEPEFMTRQDIFRRNFSSNQARRFFGDRAQYQVPGCQ